MNEALVEIEVEIAFLSEAEGGRRRPPELTVPTTYRPHLSVRDGQLLGVTFLRAPVRPEPQTLFVATVGLVYPEVDYSSLVVGTEFTVVEGARVVARGRVVHR
jgi:translation elongation factor EF-Tu-like GTPase